MKVALCLPGHMRSYKQCLVSWTEHVFSKYDTDVFIHTWDRGPNYDLFKDKVTDEKEIIESYKRAGAKNVTVSIEKAKNMDKIEGMASSKIYKYWEKDNKICHRQLMYQHYKINQCKHMRLKYEKEKEVSYDIVIRGRADVVFVDNVEILTNDYITMYLVKNPCWMCMHQDVFWFGPPDLMDQLSDMFHYLGEMYDQNPEMMVHNHYLLFFYLNYRKIKYINKYARFDVVRHPKYRDDIPMTVTDYDETPIIPTEQI